MAVKGADCGAALGAGFAQARYQSQYAGGFAHQQYPPDLMAKRWRPGWAITLNVEPDASKEEIKNAYRHLAALNHPDHGGSHEAMTAINNAYREAMGFLS